MSEFKAFVESLKKLYLKESEPTIYRTYSDGTHFTDLTGSMSFDKPSGGLWGCRDDSWKNWCAGENFPCSANYFEWKLKPTAKLFTIDTPEDFVFLLKNYCDKSTETYHIDFEKMSNDYDAIELTANGNSALHNGLSTNDPEILDDPGYKFALIFALNAWDVPSICVFHPKDSIDII